LVETLYDIAEELEDQETTRQRIKKALTYPIILIVVAVVAVILLLIFAIPKIVAMFPADALPGITVFMLSVSNFFAKYWLLVLIFIFGIVFLYKFLYKTLLPFKIFIDKIKVSLPVVAPVLRVYYMYRFSKLLSQFYMA
jgi:type IV pilus assembly protein PilC